MFSSKDLYFYIVMILQTFRSNKKMSPSALFLSWSCVFPKGSENPCPWTGIFGIDIHLFIHNDHTTEQAVSG